MDNGLELVSQALQRFCDNKVGLLYIPPGTPWNNGYIESFNNRLRKECLNRNHWNTLFEAPVVIGDFKTEHNHRHRHSALGYRPHAEFEARHRASLGLGVGDAARTGGFAPPTPNHRLDPQPHRHDQ